MIPHKDGWAQMGDMNNYLLTSQEFLDLGQGDHEEHAILLCNFFLWIDEKQGRGERIECGLAYGESPEGKMTYTFRRDKDEGHIELWAPVSGICFHFEVRKQSNCCCDGPNFLYVRPHDPICQLKKLHCIVTPTNIYANKQKHDSPIMLNYDFTKSKDWKPFFEKGDSG